MKKNALYIGIVFSLFLMGFVSGASAADTPDLSLEIITVTPSPLIQGDIATLTVVKFETVQSRHKAKDTDGSSSEGYENGL